MRWLRGKNNRLLNPNSDNLPTSHFFLPDYFHIKEMDTLVDACRFFTPSQRTYVSHCFAVRLAVHPITMGGPTVPSSPPIPPTTLCVAQSTCAPSAGTELAGNIMVFTGKILKSPPANPAIQHTALFLFGPSSIQEVIGQDQVL